MGKTAAEGNHEFNRTEKMLKKSIVSKANKKRMCKTTNRQ